MSVQTSECTRRGDAVFTECRCAPCTTRRRRARKMADTYGSSAYRVPSEDAWARIEALLERGWTPAQINRASGIHGRYVEQLISGWRTTGTQRRIGPVRAPLLAGLPLVDPPSPARVPALGTTRRLRALARMGWPVSAIAFKADLEAHTTALGQIRLGQWETVPPEWASAIKYVYREMMLRTAPRSAGTARVLKSSQARGWPSPMHFHDPDTDPLIEDREDDIAHMI